MKTAETYKRGADVEVGDLMSFGGRVHRVSKFTPYPDFDKVCRGYTARIAVFDTGAEMTVIDEHPTRVVDTERLDEADVRWQEKVRLAALDYSEELGSES